MWIKAYKEARAHWPIGHHSVPRPPPFAERQLWNIKLSVPDHCSLIPANLTTLAHFSVSAAMNFPSSSGAIGISTTPTSASRDFAFASASTALISLLSLSMISSGVFFGAPNAQPPACLIARHKFVERGDSRHCLETRSRGDRKRAQLTRLDVASRRNQRSEQDLCLSGEQIRPIAVAIRNMNQIDASHHLEQLAEHVWGAAVAGRAHIDLGRTCLGIGDELRNGLGRERGIDHHE